MSKTASCFICNQDVELTQLAEHERECLKCIQSNDIQYTRSISEESDRRRCYSSSSSGSSGSEKTPEKKSERCYLCGNQVPSHQIASHERSCKRNWKLGQSKPGPVKKTPSKASGSRSNMNMSEGIHRTKTVWWYSDDAAFSWSIGNARVSFLD